MGKLRFCIVFALVATFALFTPGGCSEEQMHQVDQAAKDVNGIGTLIRDTAASPAGAAIPQPIRVILELVGIGIVAAYGVYQKVRAAQTAGESAKLSTTLRAVADGIDTASPRASSEVKLQIGQVMNARKIHDLADPVVNQHRSKLVP